MASYNHTTQAEADAAAIKAGINSFTQDGANPATTIAAIHDAIDQGLLTPADIDDTVKQNLALRFRPGEFDPGGDVTADEVANAREQANVPALLWTSHAGQETGPALADVLFGDRNPAGRLTQTWHRSAGDLPDSTDYDSTDYDSTDGGRTYRYFTGDPLHPLRHGLSHTSFRYGPLRAGASTVGPRGTVRLALDVTNTGSLAGDEVVQLYTHQHTSRVEQPIKALRGFQRVHLAAGQTKRVTFTLAASDLRFWDVTRDRWVVEDATHDLLVGASPADIRATGQLRVRGEV